METVSVDIARPAAEKSWRAAGLSLAVAAAAAALVTICFCPRFVFWQVLAINDQLPVAPSEIDRAAQTLVQFNDPWTPIFHPNHKVIAWRLLFPVLFHYLYLPQWLFLATPQIGCLLALWLVAWLTYSRLGKWWPTCVATALFGALPWFFVSSGWLLHFDSWLVIGLLATAFVPSRWSLGLACLLTPWIDARFVLALPVAVVVRAIALARTGKSSRQELFEDLAVVLAASLPYPTIRAVAWLQGDADSGAYVQLHMQTIPTVPWRSFAEGLWSGYRVGWLLIVAAIVVAPRRAGAWWGAALALLATGSAVGGLFIAYDMSRTLMIVCPVLLLGIWLWEETRSQRLDRMLPILLLANLFFLPAYHVLWQNQWQVAPLMTEIRNWNDPPDVIKAAALLQSGRRKVEQGKVEEAQQDFAAALLLHGKYPQVLVERAHLRAREGDVAGALSDLDEAVRLRPTSAYALLLRGAIRGSRGEFGPAAEDLRRSLELTSPAWVFRGQAEQMLEAVTNNVKTALPLRAP